MTQNSKNSKIRPGSKSSSLAIKLIIAFVFVCACASFVGFVSLKEYRLMKDVVDINVIYKNISVNDVDLSGLSKEEALTKLEAAFPKDAQTQQINVKSGEQSLLIEYKKPVAKFAFEMAVDEAYNYARKGSLKERFALIKELETTPKVYLYQAEYSEENVDVTAQIAEFAKTVDVTPVNATLTRINGKFLTTPETDGVKLDVNATAVLVEGLIEKNESGDVAAVLVAQKALTTEADFADATSLIGSFTTNYKGSAEDARNVNVLVASTKINDYVLYPDEVFSTNAAFGETTYENGYRISKVIEGGKLVEGMGGGVCQVSSTLYNAVLFAELDVVERKNHSLKVGYTDWGFDATLAGTYIDLKFKNNTQFPIFIESYLADNKVYVNLYGHEIHQPGRKLVFSNALLDTFAPAIEEVIEDPTLPLGEKIVESKPVTGYKYRVYKTIYENDQKVETVTVNESTYKAVRAEVRVGTGVDVTTDLPATSNNISLSPDLSAQEGEVVETIDNGPPTNNAIQGNLPANGNNENAAPINNIETVTENVANTNEGQSPDLSPDITAPVMPE